VGSQDPLVSMSRDFKIIDSQINFDFLFLTTLIFVAHTAETDKVIDDAVDLPQRSYTPQPSPSPSLGQKAKGLRSIFGKIKRSNSGNLEDLPGEGEFKRGGVRSTAGPRLGWSGANTTKSEKPFAEWDCDALCVWLDELGLNFYEDDVRRWLKSGAKDLVKASPVDIEKELNIKNPLHRKKIVLAISDAVGKEKDDLFKNSGKLDTSWVSWLGVVASIPN
jgi:SAM domain (Sterile alpha motif)